MALSRTTWCVAGVWIFVLGAYALMPLLLGQGQALTTFGDLVQCFVPLLANAGLLLNAGTPHWRRNVFWMLLAMACTLWLVGQFQWTYYEVFLRHPMPDIYTGDVIFFVHGIPTIAALLLQPHLRRGCNELQFRVGNRERPPAPPRAPITCLVLGRWPVRAMIENDPSERRGCLCSVR